MVRIVRILQIDEQDGIKRFGPATVYRGTDFFQLWCTGEHPWFTSFYVYLNNNPLKFHYHNSGVLGVLPYIGCVGMCCGVGYGF